MTMRKGLPAKLALTDADDTRYDFLNDVVCNSDGTPRKGITSPIATNLLTGNANLNLSVGRFAAVAARDGGAIKLANDGTITVAITAAPASNSRITLVCARQDDASSTVTVPDGDNVAKVYTIDGASNVSPVAPTLPDGSVELGRLTVAAGQTTTNAMTISQATAYTAAAGASVPFKTGDQLIAWVTAQLGQRAHVIADSIPTRNASYVSNGAGGWSPVGPAETKIIPTVGGSGAVVDPLTGDIVLTNCATLDLRSLVGFDRYRLEADLVGSASGTVADSTIQFSAGGAADTAANYTYGGWYNDNNSITHDVGGVTQTSAKFGYTYLAAQSYMMWDIKLSQLNAAQQSRFLASSPQAAQEVHRSGSQGNNNVHNGLLWAFSNPQTGRIRVYGSGAH